MIASFFERKDIRKTRVETVQINLGNRCNQSCFHCHVNASYEGDSIMDRETAEKVLWKILDVKPLLVELTGGAPEMNPNLPMLIESLSKQKIKTTVRTNLTVLDLEDYSHLINFFARHAVKLIASLPWPSGEVTDSQRGTGVFEKSIRVLRKLNDAGYGNGLELNLVHNPAETHLPSTQQQLEFRYKKELKDSYGIVFNRLITMINSPIGRFKKWLINTNNYENYMKMLVNNFNSETLNYIMCRRLLTVDYMGYIYDCDFNLALGIRTKGYEDVRLWEVDFKDFNPQIRFGEHCYACTAANGSSCAGSLIKTDISTHEIVKRYYGKELQGTKDLKTAACCSPLEIPDYVKEILFLIPEEVMEKYYGCGSPVPLVLKGLKVLDIGCGTGRDCYVLSKLVGEDGFVYGIDMTEEQIRVAEKYRDEMKEKFGYSKGNVRFIHDYIENLKKHFREDALDLVVSNCVFNLIDDKEGVLKQIYSILKEGGEFYFSDIYADRRLPDWMKKEPVLVGECLGGALYWRDFERMAKRVGFYDPRIVSKRVVEINNDDIKALVGNIKFYSITYRLWKVHGIEDACEDYGHIAIYKGGIKESPFSFTLDAAHHFEKDKPERICGNTALILSRTRLKDHFSIIGDFNSHFGDFKKNDNIFLNNESSNTEKFSCC